MVTRAGGICLGLLCVLGCGGKAAVTETRASGGQSGAGMSSVGGATATSGSTSTSGGTASGGATSGGAPATAGDGGGGIPNLQAGAAGAAAAGTGGATDPSCYSIDPSCNVEDAYIAIYDNPPVKLRYEFNANCDQCSPSCADCRAQPCGLWAYGSSGCGILSLEISACSEPGGQGVCLDTTGSAPHYTDATGKRWPMPRLFGDTNQMGSDQADGAVDLNLDLSLPNGSSTRSLPVSAHLCARIDATLVVCK